MSSNNKFLVVIICIAVVSASATLYFAFSDNNGKGDKAKVTFRSKKLIKEKKRAISSKRDRRSEKISESRNDRAKPTLSLTEDEEATLSAEMKKVLADLRRAVDQENRKAVSKLAEQILVKMRKNGDDAVPPFVRSKAIEAISFFLPDSLADLAGFMADSDPEVLEEAMAQFELAIDDPDLGDRELASILKTFSKALTDPDAIDSFFMGIESDMRNSVAVETYKYVAENGSDAIKRRIWESVEDFTGEDNIKSAKDLDDWLSQNPDDPDDDDFYGGSSSSD